MKNINISLRSQNYYVESIMPYLKDLPEVKEANGLRGVKKTKILEPLIQRLRDNYDQVVKPFKKWLKYKSKLSEFLYTLKHE